MRARRLSPAQRIARRLLALSRTVRDCSTWAYHRGWLGAVATSRLLMVADAITAKAAHLAVRGLVQSKAAPAPAVPSVTLVTMRTLPVGVLAAALWPGLRGLAVLFAVACAAASAVLRKQSPLSTRLTDWDVAVAACFGGAILDRVLS